MVLIKSVTIQEWYQKSGNESKIVSSIQTFKLKI